MEADRTVSVDTAGDANALLAIEPGAEGSNHVTTDSGAVKIDIASVNPNAVTAIDQLLTITNNGEETIEVGFDNEYAIQEGDYDEPPGGWGYATNGAEDAASVVWASPLPGDMDKTLREVRPELVTTGFDGGSTLVDGRIDHEVEKKAERTISPGKSLNVGIVVDTRDSTVPTIPPELDATIEIYAEAANFSGE